LAEKRKGQEIYEKARAAKLREQEGNPVEKKKFNSELWDNEISGPMDEADWAEQDRLTWDYVYRMKSDPKAYFRRPEDLAKYEAYAARMKAAEAAGKVLLPGMPPETP